MKRVYRQDLDTVAPSSAAPTQNKVNAAKMAMSYEIVKFHFRIVGGSGNAFYL